jgi:sterol desaturase/sphingolipid hydroxylase (fatty acid hydroxylase superfamily)
VRVVAFHGASRDERRDISRHTLRVVFPPVRHYSAPHPTRQRLFTVQNASSFTAHDALFRTRSIMLTTGKLTFYVTLFVVAVSLIEACVLTLRKRRNAQHSQETFDWSEVWLSLVDLAGRKLLALLPVSLAAPIFDFAWKHRLFTLRIDSIALALVLFVAQEFCYYWYHRASHRIRFFWATHAVHHSPNQLTLSSAYRLGWTGKLTGPAMFFAPLVWLGVRPEIVLAILSLNLLYQFWLHNTWIPKLGWFEYVFNTPSNHRVHHASNVDYLDANYGES